MRLVVEFSEGDGYTYCCEVVKCINFKSVDDFLLDLMERFEVWQKQYAEFEQAMAKWAKEYEEAQTNWRNYVRKPVTRADKLEHWSQKEQSLKGTLLEIGNRRPVSPSTQYTIGTTKFDLENFMYRTEVKRDAQWVLSPPVVTELEEWHAQRSSDID